MVYAIAFPSLCQFFTEVLRLGQLRRTQGIKCWGSGQFRALVIWYLHCISMICSQRKSLPMGIWWILAAMPQEGFLCEKYNGLTIVKMTTTKTTDSHLCTAAAVLQLSWQGCLANGRMDSKITSVPNLCPTEDNRARSFSPWTPMQIHLTLSTAKPNHLKKGLFSLYLFGFLLLLFQRWLKDQQHL